MPATQRRGSGKSDPLQVRAVARLNELLEERGVSQTQLAKLAGFKQGHVSRILNGQQRETAFWVIARLAHALGVSMDWLVEEPRTPRAANSEPPPPALAPAPVAPASR